jgi:hypothetical protein
VGDLPWHIPEEGNIVSEENAPEGKVGRVEEFVVSGDTLVAKVRELVHEGNIRKISLQTVDGSTLIEVPLVLGMAGVAAAALLAPVWAAIGAIAALVARLKIVVERVE